MTRIPIHGSMTRPGEPQDGIDEMRQGRVEWSGEPIDISISTSEFTSVCPTTGQPDFNNITINYVPRDFYLESKTVKFYLWSFREYGAHCETLAKKIATDIKAAIDCVSIEVIVDQSPRGGLKIISKYKL